MTDRAKKIYTAWEDEFVKENNPFYEHRALAAAIRKIIDEYEFSVDEDFKCVSSEDLLILAYNLKNSK